MTRTVACLDGLDPDYLDATPTPSWDAIAETGTTGVCDGLVPSLTNVNNVGIVTGRHPAETGVTANTFLDDGERVYVEDARFLDCRTVLADAADEGDEVLALVAKEKLRRLVGSGGVEAASAQEPPGWLTDLAGDPPGIYSGDASAWLLDAAVAVAEERAPDVLYVSTTDVVPHKHAPGEAEAEAWVRSLDDGLGRLHEFGPVAAVADHGMNHKTRRVDVEAMLADAGVAAETVRCIRDRHVYHHRNLGGAAYVYTDDPGAARAALAEAPGTEVVDRATACDRFRLDPERVGDLLVLGDERTAFGPIEDGETRVDEVDLRSHGSVHERAVPYLASTGETVGESTEIFAAAGVRPGDRV
ncbi:MAG: alkaline phosphatase family protein [Haloferacaceae archaeon]